MRTNVIARAPWLLDGTPVASLSSDAAAGQDEKKPVGEPRSDTALVYMVRLGEFAGSGRTERVFIEDTLVGVLPNRTYTFTHVEPGTHLLWASFHKDPLMVDLAPGRPTIWSSNSARGSRWFPRRLEPKPLPIRRTTGR